MFRSPSVFILRVYSIKYYNKNCVSLICPRFEFIKFYKFSCWTDSPHTTFYCTLLTLYTLRTVAEGDRNMWM